MNERKASKAKSSRSTNPVSISGGQSLCAIGNKIPVGNLLHSERLQTFIEAGWPGHINSCIYLCNAQTLAQAGLEYHAPGEARCVICRCIVKDLELTSDPWSCHQKMNPKCLLVTMGKLSKPDGYTLKQFVKLVGEQRQQYLIDECEKRKQHTIDLLTQAVIIDRKYAGSKKGKVL